MKNLSRREKLMVIALVVAFAVYMYVSYFLTPMLDRIDLERSNIANYQNQLVDIQNIETSKPQLEQELKTVMKQYEKSLKKVPTNKRDPEIAYNLKKLADEAGPIISSISIADTSGSDGNVNPADPASSMVSVPVSINLNEASFLDLMNLVNLIETDYRMAKIRSINVSKANQVTVGDVTMSGVASSLMLDYFYVPTALTGHVEYDFDNSERGKINMFE